MSNDKCPTIDRAGTVNLTQDLLGQLLGLREGLRVTGARWEPLTHCLYVRVDGPGLPSLGEGELPMPVKLKVVSKQFEG